MANSCKSYISIFAEHMIKFIMGLRKIINCIVKHAGQNIKGYAKIGWSGVIVEVGMSKFSKRKYQIEHRVDDGCVIEKDERISCR